jgi:hypothetical protein
VYEPQIESLNGPGGDAADQLGVGGGRPRQRTRAHPGSQRPIKIAGGSWGAQIGGEAVDLVMLLSDAVSGEDAHDKVSQVAQSKARDRHVDATNLKVK